MGWGNESLLKWSWSYDQDGGLGHMTKMAAMLIYINKTLKNLLLWNRKADDLETWYASSGARVLPSLLK